MADAILGKLRRLAARLEKAKRERNAAILEARKTHGPGAIAEAAGISKTRVIQIVKEEGGNEHVG